MRTSARISFHIFFDKTTKLGTKVICPDKDLLYEEAPEAYKDIEHIIADLKQFELAEPIARLTPIVNIKP